MKELVLTNLGFEVSLVIEFGFISYMHWFILQLTFYVKYNMGNYLILEIIPTFLLQLSLNHYAKISNQFQPNSI